MAQELERMSRQQLVKEVRQLQDKCDRTADVVTLEREGGKIILPAMMSHQEAIDNIYKMMEEEQTEVAIDHTISCHPLDGALALSKAISQRYGFSQMVPTPSFFGANPPSMISMQIGPTESIQIPWGRMRIPDIDGYIEVDYRSNSGIPTFSVGGVIKQKHKEEIHALTKAAERIVNTESVYHGKAMSINMDWMREGGKFNPSIHGFKFLNLEGVMDTNLIFDKMTESIIERDIFAFIEHADRCRERKIPLKRGILLEGPYGVGKTMSAYVTAKKATDNGWTFILCEDARDLQHVIEMAKRYEPAVIFCEDIDRVVTEDRTLTVDTILNTVDGVKSKDSEILVICSTNHVEKINKAMLRPGRLDAVISLQAPDEEAVIRLVRHYGRELIPVDEDMTVVGEELKGQIPAVIREVVERAKMSAIIRSKDGEPEVVHAEDLVVAAESMKRHLALLAESKEVPTKLEELGSLIVETIAERLDASLADKLEPIVKDAVADAMQ